jgi:hypothetical protein
MLAKRLLEAYFPIGARKGKEYAAVIVGDDTYEEMTYISSNGETVEFWDKYGKPYTFNLSQVKIELRK